MRSFTPLWSTIVDSSIWDEPDFVCKVFLTMLALKDLDDICRYNPYQLAKRSKKTEEEVLEALRILSSPDSRRKGPQEHEGRRIEAVEEGWLILNGAKYREEMKKEMERARWRRAQAAKRSRQKPDDQTPIDPVPEMPLTDSQKVDFHGFLGDPTTHPNVNF